MTSLTLAAALLVAADPPVRTDLAGDPLPPGAVARIGTTRYRVRGASQQVFLSPDGRTAVTRSEDNRLRLWDADTGRVTGEIEDPDLYSWSADQSPDGKLVAVFGHDKRGKPAPDTTLRLYDLTMRKPVWTSVIDDEYFNSGHAVRFTPDGKRLITVAASDARVWDVKSGEALLRQRLPLQPQCLALTPDKTVAVSSSQALYLWDWESGVEPRKVDVGARPAINLMMFSPDGKTVFAGRYGPVLKGFDVTTGKPAGDLNIGGPSAWVSYSPDGKTLATGSINTGGRLPREGFVVLLDPATGKDKVRLDAGRSYPNVGTWSADGKRFAAAGFNRFWVWDTETGKALGPDVPAHDSPVSGLQFAPDGRLSTSADDTTIRAWDAATGKELLKLTMLAMVRGLAVSPDGSLVAGNGLRDDCRIWDAKTGKQTLKLLGHGQMGGFRRARFSGDEQTLLTFGDDGHLRAWNALTGKLKAECRVHPKGPPTRPGLKADEEKLRDDFFSFRFADLSPDGDTLAIALGTDVSIVSAADVKERFRLDADPNGVDNLAFSPDGKRLATIGLGFVPAKPRPGAADDRPKGFRVTVWDLSEAKPVAQFRTDQPSLRQVLAFTPDGKQLVTDAAPSGLQFWDAKTGEAAGTLDLPDRASRVAFDPDGKRLAVACWDTTVVVYDLARALKPPKKE